MATNPMQRKARNSFLLGMLITTLIAAVIIAVLIFQLINLQNKQEDEQKTIKQVYVITEDIKSGEQVSLENLKVKNEATDINATELLTPSDLEEIKDNGDIISKELISKINLVAGTIVTKNMVTDSNNKVNNDTRLQEYNMLVLPIKLEQNDYVDIRMTMPDGLDYIVVSKKQVKDISVDTIWLNMSEDEIVTMSNAIVEAYITGAKLYASTYVEPGNQANATPTYPISTAALKLIDSNANVLNEAKTALLNRYKTELRNDNVQQQLNNKADDAVQNVETNMKEEIEKAIQNREQYFEQMEASAYEVVE